MDIFSTINAHSGHNIAHTIAIVAAFLTFLAIGGSWYFGGIKDNITAVSIEKSREEAAKAKAEAEKAKEEAAKANAEAEKAKEEAAKANVNAKKIELDVELAKKEAVAQEEIVEKLKLKVEQEARYRVNAEVELIKLQQKIKWRKINKKLFFETFRIYCSDSKEMEIEIMYNPSDMENESFSYEVCSTLGSLGCEVGNPKGLRSSSTRSFATEFGGMSTNDPIFSGIFILTPNVEDDLKLFKEKKGLIYAIHEAFSKCGYVPSLVAPGFHKWTQKETIKILIDSRRL